MTETGSAEAAGSSDTAGSQTGDVESVPVVRAKKPVRDDEPLVPDRSSDDSDVGWNDGGDTNDERLRRDVPPPW